MGTATHDEDLLMVAPAMEFLAQKYSNVEFQIVGGIGKKKTLNVLSTYNFPWRSVSPSRYDTEYPLFALWMQKSLDWDIAIAPLADSMFSRCKSDIKFLDYSILRTAAVYSRVDAYSTTVQDQEFGLLVDNNSDSWLRALDHLVSDSVFRQKLRRNAWNYVIQNRILARGIDAWVDCLRSFCF
jgi:glycosyltransferase involved in cell wall biosynthesis